MPLLRSSRPNTLQKTPKHDDSEVFLAKRRDNDAVSVAKGRDKRRSSKREEKQLPSESDSTSMENEDEVELEGLQVSRVTREDGYRERCQSSSEEGSSEEESDSDLEDLAEQVSQALKQNCGSSEPGTDSESEPEVTHGGGKKTAATESGSETETQNVQFVIDTSGGTLSNSQKGDDGGHSSDQCDDASTDDDTDGEDHRMKKKSSELASTLQAGVDIEEMSYINSNVFVKPSTKKLDDILKQGRQSELLKKSVLTADFEKKETILPYQQGFHQMKKARKAERAKTKGKGWYGLPATELTEERKNDLAVLQMRRSLDPKRFYKAPDLRGVPKYFQMATVVESAADFYSGRIPKKQRKKTLVDELLEDAEFRKFNKRKYAEIQEKQSRSKGAHRHMRRMKKKKK